LCTRCVIGESKPEQASAFKLLEPYGRRGYAGVVMCTRQPEVEQAVTDARKRRRLISAAFSLVVMLASGFTRAQENSQTSSTERSDQPESGTAALQKATQNPIADLVSVPIQDNVTRVNAEQASKRSMRGPTRNPNRGRLMWLGK